MCIKCPLAVNYGMSNTDISNSVENYALALTDISRFLYVTLG